MRPGPDLDAEIVRTLWRYIVVYDGDTGEYRMVSAYGTEKIPPYSTDPAAAEQISEFFKDKGWRLRTRRDKGQYAAAFMRGDGAVYRYFFADTLAEAICHAALAIPKGTNIQTKNGAVCDR